MESTHLFEFILFLLVIILGLEVLAKRVNLPPAVALIAGGIALAVMPGVPDFELDPDLVLVLFLPPLLMEGAFFTAWTEFRRQLPGILALAVGAVFFTTLAVGLAVHWAVPALPWAACFALGAVVSPPDAVAARAILERLPLPRRLMVELQGESLLDDATGLTLLRFAVTAGLTGGFNATHAGGTFMFLALGGMAVGGVLGLLWVRLVPLLDDVSTAIAATFALSWVSYIAGEAVHVSGVLSTVTAGLVLGWYQHEMFSAALRVRAVACWRVMVFILESFVFILIGLTMRAIAEHLGSVENAVSTYLLPVSVVLVAMIASRFIWIFTADLIRAGLYRVFGWKGGRFSFANATVMSWAGMRGVVTIAVALALPEEMPGRALIVISAFASICATVIVQGTTIGWLIRRLKPHDEHAESSRSHLSRAEAATLVARAQIDAIETPGEKNALQTPDRHRVAQFIQRLHVLQAYSETPDEHDFADREAEHEAVLAAIGAGRQEVLRLHRSGQIPEHLLYTLEHQLDLQELAADTERF